MDLPSCSKTRNPFTGAEANAVGVKVDKVSKSYAGMEVLKNVSFDVQPGEIFVIMGPSGSGKSVLLRHIAGLEVPSTGTITIDGKDPTLEATREAVRVALVFQAGALFNSLSVYDNLALYPREHRAGDAKAIDKRVMHALKILSVEDAARKFPSELSGGMKKRVSIARALVMEPQLLLYDEPTSELDPVMSATISEIIATLKNEYSVTSIVVTHDRALALNPDLAEAWSDRGVILARLNRAEDALASYDRALALRPDYARALSNRGAALADLGRLQAALDSHDRAGALGIFAHVLGNFHRAEMRSAHRAEVRDLRALRGQGLVVEVARGHRIEGKRPSFFQDLQFLLIGPLWLLADLYRRLGIRY